MNSQQLRAARWVLGAGIACIGAAGAVAVSVAARLAHLSVTVDRGQARPVRVVEYLAAEGDTRPRVWLSGEGVAAVGNHSLLFDAASSEVPPRDRVEAAGHARLGPVLERQGRKVLREVLQVDRGTLETGATGRMVGWWFTDPAELGFRVELITIASDVGELDAWIVHPEAPLDGRWAIHTHGRGASPAETLRGVAPFARAGITSIVISYRNDPGQPAGLNTRYGMGIAEARDVDAAIAAAARRGARRVTLVGWSMGGTASLVAAREGTHRDLIDGLVLDSPGVDWPAILRSHGLANGVPPIVTRLGMRMLSRGWVASGVPDGVDLDSLTPESFAATLTVPSLIIAGPGDRFVDWEGARTLTSLRPDLVRLHEIGVGGHVRLWNVDQQGWEDTVSAFVTALPKPGEPGR